MPILNNADAIYIGDRAVDIGAFVGRRQVWTPPVPSTGLAVFANPNGNMELSEGGRVARYTGADGAIGGCFCSHPIEEPTEIQFLLASSAGASGFQLYNGPSTSAPNAAWGQWWGEPGLTIMLSPTWNKIAFANQGIPGYELTAALLHDIGYFPSVVERGVVFIRPDGRGWIRSEALGGAFLGGGNPATNTAPSFELPGPNALRFGGASNNINASVELLLPDAYIGSPIAGFRRAVAG